MKRVKKLSLLIGATLLMLFLSFGVNGQNAPSRQTSVPPRPDPQMRQGVISPEIQSDSLDRSPLLLSTLVGQIILYINQDLSI